MANTAQSDLPHHVGIIMDGNGRWAKKRGLPRNMGHKQGAKAFGDTVRHANKRGISHLTVYAFSTENWKRPADEVEGIMSLLRSYLRDMSRYERENIRMRVLGDKAPLAPDIVEMIDDMEARSAHRTGLNLNIALNYGGQDEIVHAVRQIAALVQSGRIAPEEISREMVAEHLYTTGQPPVDLVIRTSGEQRISNFLLWQSAYAEYVFTDVLWPDFGPAELDAALAQYAGRTRRMGGV